MVDITDFRNGMAMLAGAVNIITTDGPQGLAGFTATAVCSVTDQPPTLLVCMNRASWAHPIFSANGVLCAAQLACDTDNGTVVNFDCRIVQTHDVGSHSVFYCEVEGVRQGASQTGLVYFNRGYHAVGETVELDS